MEIGDRDDIELICNCPCVIEYIVFNAPVFNAPSCQFLFAVGPYLGIRLYGLAVGPYTYAPAPPSPRIALFHILLSEIQMEKFYQ